MTSPKPLPEQMEMNLQPLDEIMTRLNLKNSDLVEKSTEQLTHKMVAKGRKGCRLTINVRYKILNALNACHSSKKFALADLFNSID